MFEFFSNCSIIYDVFLLLPPYPKLGILIPKVYSSGVNPKVRSSQLESQATIFLSFTGSNKCSTYLSNEELVYISNSGVGFGISHWS